MSARGRHIVICNWRDTAHPRAGGAELYCEQVADRLARRGITVTLLTARPRGTARHEATGFGQIVRRGGTFGVYLAALWWLLTHRREVDGVIDSQNGIPFFSPLVLRRATPVVLLIHHVHQQQFGAYFRWPVSLVGRWLERTVSRWVYGPRALCVVSPSSRREVRRQLDFSGPVFLTPCGQAPAAGEPGRRATAPTIVVVSRMVEHKRLDLLLAAVAVATKSVPGLRLDLVGDGPALAELRRLAAELGVTGRVRFHGRVSDEDRDALLETAWLTVGTSAGEGWGLSMMEAAVRGVPAVAMRVPGLRDSVLHQQTGWLVDGPQELPGVLVDVLDRLADPGVAAWHAERCTAWAARFSWTATADRMLAVLDSEARRRSRRRTNDAAAVVRLSPSMFSRLDLRALRRTDQIDFADGEVRLLLGGADERDALAALRRAGLPDDAHIQIRAARSADLLGWPVCVADAADAGQKPAIDRIAPRQPHPDGVHA
ncbi:glycosyltransferase family 4 protein [Dactylosporangium sp. CS-047395]|uniref:glycosyltransferase family 4 protein n=1 Tax=Dactylosporangium sp. CS-047395 TaxID=3239936 RepID=UPI003D90FEA0